MTSGIRFVLTSAPGNRREGASATKMPRAGRDAYHEAAETKPGQPPQAADPACPPCLYSTQLARGRCCGPFAMIGALTMVTSLFVGLGVWFFGIRRYLSRHGGTVITGATWWVSA